MFPKLKRIVLISLASLSLLLIIVFLALNIYNRQIRKGIAQKISDKTAAFIGQGVEIKDLSYSASEGFYLHNIRVKNPKEFGAGEFLGIEKLHLNIKFADLMAGRFDFREISVINPKLTLSKNREGRLNISDKLLEVFRRKSDLKYRIDEFRIESGSFKFNYGNNLINLPEKLSGLENINVRFRDISSDKGLKTQIEGNAAYAGSSLTLKGWAYIRDDPKKFSISLELGEIPLSEWNRLAGRYNINIEKAKLGAAISMEGNSSGAINIKTLVQIRDTVFPFATERINNISIKNGCRYILNKDTVYIDNFSIDSGQLFSVKAKGLVNNIVKAPQYEAEISINTLDLSAFKLPADYGLSGFLRSGSISLRGHSFSTLPVIKARAGFRDITVTKAKRSLIQKAVINASISSDGKDTAFSATASAGKLSFNTSGTIKDTTSPKRLVRLNTVMPSVTVADIRDALWDVFPDRLLYAGMEGSLSSEFSADYSGDNLNVYGKIFAKALSITGENGEFSIGPADGALPLNYTKNIKGSTVAASDKNRRESIFDKIPVFEKNGFPELKKFYAGKKECTECNKITVGSLSYGLPLMKDINIFIEQTGDRLDIPLFSAIVSGGKIKGTASLNISDGMSYRAGYMLEGLSLKTFCEGFEPIKGYISGLVNGTAFIKGSGAGLANLMGKAELWTYGSDKEKTKISREFLRKVGGPSLKAYLGDRNFDKGNVNMYIKDGFIIFDELEISNRNLLGIKDLSVKVAPFNNRISIDHLMWTITEAAQRAKSSETEKQK